MIRKIGLCAAVAICAFAVPATAADSSKKLLSAARDGDMVSLRALTGPGANLEARDKRGKTPLLLAAQNGHADAVRLLLEKGASPAARDKTGLTAYGLAFFSSPGAERDATLAALPKPARIRVNLQAIWLRDNLATSCFQGKDELTGLMNGIHPDALVLGALADLARTAGRDVLEVASATAEGLKPDAAAITPPQQAADANVILAVRPGAACSRQADNLTLAIDVRVMRDKASTPILQKTFGGGLKGLHAQPVTNPTQYPPFFEKWAKSHANSIYWDVLKALMRSSS